MIDSWMPRKLDPGFDATYSKSSVLMTSTMKSPPGRSVVRTSVSPDGSVSRGAMGAGPWAGGDASYTANINTWIAIVTETYSAFVEVGTVRNQNATSTFNGYNLECMALEIHNTEKLGDTNGGPLPANFPSFWNWIGCFDQGPAGPGEWGDVDSITLTVDGCETVATEPKTWGGVKAMYRN
jgi:hypothetical protein